MQHSIDWSIIGMPIVTAAYATYVRWAWCDLTIGERDLSILMIVTGSTVSLMALSVWAYFTTFVWL